jgi:hypothetical protein
MGCGSNSCTKEIGDLATFSGCPETGEKVLCIKGQKTNGQFVYGWRTISELFSCYIKGTIAVVAGGGYSDSPIVDSNNYQNDLLIGIGNTVDDGVAKITIFIDNQAMCNFGINASFDFDNTTGTIVFYTDGYRFGEGSSLYINLNQ